MAMTGATSRRKTARPSQRFTPSAGRPVHGDGAGYCVKRLTSATILLTESKASGVA
jgi:hypothetical protein